MKYRRVALLSVSLLVGVACMMLAGCIPGPDSAELTAGKSPLVGAWLIVETTENTPDGSRTNKNPQPGLYLFTEGHFSNMIVPREERPLFDSETTDAEKLAAFSNFIADSGSYEVKGSRIFTHNIVAKVPRAMRLDRKPSSGISYKFSFDGEDLLLTLSMAWAPPNGTLTYRLQPLEVHR